MVTHNYMNTIGNTSMVSFQSYFFSRSRHLLAFDTVRLFVPPIVSVSRKIKREFTSALQSRGTAAGPGIVREAARLGIYSFAIRQSSLSKAGACFFKNSHKLSQMLPLTLK